MNPENTPPQPPANQPAALNPASPQQVSAPEPQKSKGLAIASLITGIIGLMTCGLGIGILFGLIALIIGIIALAKHSGGKGMSVAGICLGAVAVLLGPILVAITIVSYNQIGNRAEATANQSIANTVLKKASAYNLLNARGGADAYPTFTQLTEATDPSVALDPDAANPQVHEGDASSVSKDRPVAYEGCSTGATVYFWDAARSTVGQKTVGSPESC